MGDPIFYRFDKFIKFDDLSVSAICQIIDLHIESKCNMLSTEELSIIKKDYITSQLKSVANKIQNVRQIEKIVDEYISMQLVDSLIGKENKK